LIPAVAILCWTACASVTNDGVGTSGSGGTGTGGAVGMGTGGRPIVSTGAGGTGKISGGNWGGSGDKNCGLQTFDLQRKPADIFLVLDRSASMQKDSMGNTAKPPANPSKWAQVVPAVTQVVAQTAASVPWGMKTFPETGAECASGTVSNKIDVPVAPMNAAALNAAIAATTPNGNGTPTAAAMNVAVSYLRDLSDGNPKYILLATDGAPSCSGSVGSLAKNTTLARTDAVAAVAAAAIAGIHTFVIGVATTQANDIITLNSLAVAGLEPRMDPTTRFFLASSQADLVTALEIITGQLSSCAFPLSPVPPDPTNIAVKVSGARALQDTSHQNGWDYTALDHSAIAVYGPWCDVIKTTAANMVQIIYGCPNITIP
jgi:hypothetical protein